MGLHYGHHAETGFPPRWRAWVALLFSTSTSRRIDLQPFIDKAASRLNPWKAKDENEDAQAKLKRMQRIEMSLCIRCHDQDNDSHWNFDKWFKKGIVHMTPKD